MDVCWVKENKTGETALKVLLKEVDLKMFIWYYMACTDRPIESGKVSPAAIEHMIDCEDVILELRFFAAEREQKIWRNGIFEPWSCRLADDTYFSQMLQQKEDPLMENLKLRRIKEEQFLDIDLPKTRKLSGQQSQMPAELELQTVQATGGGVYYLPEIELTEQTGIRLYYYLDYEESGQAVVADWRLAEYCTIGEECV